MNYAYIKFVSKESPYPVLFCLSVHVLVLIRCNPSLYQSKPDLMILSICNLKMIIYNEIISILIEFLCGFTHCYILCLQPACSDGLTCRDGKCLDVGKLLF